MRGIWKHGTVDATSSRWLPGAGHDAAHGPHMFREQVNDLGAAVQKLL